MIGFVLPCRVVDENGNEEYRDAIVRLEDQSGSIRADARWVLDVSWRENTTIGVMIDLADVKDAAQEMGYRATEIERREAKDLGVSS